MLISRSRNGGSSLEGEDLEVVSIDSFVLCSFQWGFMGGGLMGNDDGLLNGSHE